MKLKIPKTIDTNFWKPYRGWSVKKRVHLVFLTKIQDKKIINEIEKVQKELSKDKSYTRFPKSHYHITLKPLTFLKDSYDNKKGALDIKQINKMIKEARKEFSKTKLFKIKIQKINLFSGVVFLEVQDNDKLEKINKRLMKIKNINPSPRDYPNFIPHVTIGAFKSKNIKPLIKTIEKLRDTKFGETEIKDFDFVFAHWYKTKFPRFESYKKIKLKR